MSNFIDLLGLNGIVDESGGYASAGITPVDLDGDGIPDALAADTDGDGILDTNYFDTDGDGFIDTSQHTYVIDTNDDGIIDTIVVDTDFGMDGSIESQQFMGDIDQDGILDIYGEAFSVDADGDGVVDTLHFSIDGDLDGVFDVSGISGKDGSISFIDEIVSSQSNADEQLAMDLMKVENFNPNAYDPDSIIGNPSGAIQVYHTQETDASCAVAAQEFVLDQLTGKDFSESELRDMAEAFQWYSPEGGTPVYNVGNILVEHGLTVQRDFGNSIDDLSNCLENGGAVIVGVDIYELYSGNNDFFGPGMDANHALQIIGIDKSDSGNPMVIVNDSGVPNGCGAMIPMDNFMDAWEDSDFFMVEAYA